MKGGRKEMPDAGRPWISGQWFDEVIASTSTVEQTQTRARGSTVSRSRIPNGFTSPPIWPRIGDNVMFRVAMFVCCGETPRIATRTDRLSSLSLYEVAQCRPGR